MRYIGDPPPYRAAEFREILFHDDCFSNDLPKEDDQLSQIVNEREEDDRSPRFVDEEGVSIEQTSSVEMKNDRTPSFVDEEGVVIHEASNVGLNKYRAFGGMMLAITTTLYDILRRFQDYRYNRTELSIALGSWALAYTPKPPVRRCGTGSYRIGHPIQWH